MSAVLVVLVVAPFVLMGAFLVGAYHGFAKDDADSKAFWAEHAVWKASR